MLELYFIRHAKTEMNKNNLWCGLTDCDITLEGKEDLQKSFNFSSDIFDAYYCSPLKRTRQTLDAIIPGQNPIIDKRLIERDLGDWEGQPYSIIDADTTELYIQGKVQPPNGETYEQVKARVVSFVSDMFQSCTDNKVLIVSHATILRMVRDVYLPAMEKKPIKNSEMIIVTGNDFYCC